MTESQYLMHAEIMSHMRKQFLKWWRYEGLPVLKQCGYCRTEKSTARAMIKNWHQWRRLGHGNHLKIFLSEPDWNQLLS